RSATRRTEPLAQGTEGRSSRPSVGAGSRLVWTRIGAGRSLGFGCGTQYMITFDRYVQSLAPNGADVPKCELSPPRTRAPEMSSKNLAALSFGTFLSLLAATAVAVFFGTSFLLLTHPWDEMPATRSKTAAATAVIPPALTATAAASAPAIPPAQTDTAAAATTVIP